MPDCLVATLIAHFARQPRIRAGSVIMTVFGDAVLPRGGKIWLGSLIRLLTPLGINDRLVRTSVFRLGQEGWLATEAVGRRANYVLTAEGQMRFEEAARHIYATTTSIWDRRWRLIMVVGHVNARHREQLRRVLFWQGFGLLGNDCFIHPSTQLDVALDALVAEGLGETLPNLMPMLAVENQFGTSARDEDMVRHAWNLQALADAYAAFTARYMPVAEALRQPALHDMPDEDAFLLRMLLIHEYRRLLLRDPELPTELLPHNWPGHEARLLCRELYRRLLPGSERHLDAHMQCADGSVPKPLSLLQRRFQGEDPLHGWHSR